MVFLQSDKSCLAVVSSAQNEVPGVLSSFSSVGTLLSSPALFSLAKLTAKDDC